MIVLFFEDYWLSSKDFYSSILPYPLLIQQNAPFYITIKKLSKQPSTILSSSSLHPSNASPIQPYETFDPSMISI